VRPGIADEKGVAVGLRFCDAQAPDHARRRAHVFGDDRLPQKLAHLLRLDARARVDPAAGREGDDERQGPGGPILRCGRAGQRDRRGQDGNDRPEHGALLELRHETHSDLHSFHTTASSTA